MSDPIQVNVTGRLMLLLSSLGLHSARALRIYCDAVGSAVRYRLAQQSGQSFTAVSSILDEELALLETALRERALRPVATIQEVTAAAEEQPDEAVADPAVPVEQLPVHGKRAQRSPSGYVPSVKSMEEKLKDERTPVQILLREDCVTAGLIDAAAADKLVRGMVGKLAADAERDVVEFLRQVLQDQVKSFIRKARGGPWADPRTQEDLRKDIHAARTVRSILMLSRQLVKEYHTWQDEHGRGGILGLFSARHKTVRR